MGLPLVGLSRAAPRSNVDGGRSTPDVRSSHEVLVAVRDCILGKRTETTKGSEKTRIERVPRAYRIDDGLCFVTFLIIHFVRTLNSKGEPFGSPSSFGGYRWNGRRPSILPTDRELESRRVRAVPRPLEAKSLASRRPKKTRDSRLRSPVRSKSVLTRNLTPRYE